VDSSFEGGEEESSGEVGEGEFCVWWEGGKGSDLNGLRGRVEDVFAVGEAGVVEAGGEGEDG